MGGREECAVVSVDEPKTSDGVTPASTTSAADTEASGTSLASGKGVSRRSRNGSGRTAGRRIATTAPTPPATSPPGLKAEAEELLKDKTKLAERLKQDLMEHYLIESEAGKDAGINPQHSRASRKQAKELAELIWRLNAEANK